jgi:hypothetical protein
MRGKLLRPSVLAILTILLGASASAEVRKVPYPRIKVEIAQAYKPDPAFEEMRKAFADAVARKDTNALFALLAPSFVWTVGGALAGDFDPGRDALHNFKVLFGFRQYGRDVDGDVDEGPFWTSLAAFANETTFYQTVEDGIIVCSPIAASVADADVFEEARSKVETDDEAADWYFVLRDNTPVARAPDDKGLPVARLGQEAVPVLRAHPTAPEGQPAVAPTHFEVLLPSGRSGWIPAAAALPLDTGRLCYVAAPGGMWKIAVYDAAE